MITTLAGTAIAMISVSIERGSLMGGEVELGEEEDQEAFGKDVREDIGEEEEEEDEEVGEVGVGQVGTLGKQLRAEIHESAASDRRNR